MKNKILFLLLLNIFATMGCSKFLDREPLGSAIEGDLTDVGGVDGKVFGLYGQMRDLGGIAGLPLAFLESVRSDDAIKGYQESNTASYEVIGDQFQYNKGDTWLIPQYWNDHYTLINRCNDVLQYIDSLKLTDGASMINKAEAKFFRAYAYFDLVRTFGEVPKVDFKIYNIGDGNIAKSPVSDIYNLINEDLVFAKSYLPVSWSSTYTGRLTKGTANTLMAKTMLYQQNWAGALAESEAVINSNIYSLYPSYADFFSEKGENSTESIFEVQNYCNAIGSVSYCNELAERTGIRGSGYFDQGWGWDQPSEALVNAYETGDPRKEATILFRGQPDGYGKIIPADLQLPYWNKKVYGEPLRLAATGFRRASYLNVRLLRYADVLLMAAEAANEVGDATKALDYLNQIRARARGTATVLPDVTTTDQAELRAAVKHERRVEFGMEYERFYDLVRWNDAVTVLGVLGYTDRCRYYPIPQVVIDKSQGILVQNPEW
jgi:tetratricopeptide (TPR) repeat protein